MREEAKLKIEPISFCTSKPDYLGWDAVPGVVIDKLNEIIAVLNQHIEKPYNDV